MRILPPMRIVLYGLLAAVLAALIFGPPGASPAQASGSTFTLSTVVAVPLTNFYPPSPCSEGFNLSGQFRLSAQVTVPNDPTKPMVISDLHLDATGITGVGLTTGVTYTGSQGSDQVFNFNTFNPPSFQFTPSFTLYPPSPTFPPSPCHTAVTFDTTLTLQTTIDSPPPSLSATWVH
jgi:hypothetical protein